MKKQVCVGGFLVKNNRFLLGKRSNRKEWAPGVWDIIGGHSLKDEHPLYTLQREAREETGAEIRNAELLCSMDVPDNSPQGSFYYHIYMVTAYKGEITNCSAEHTEIKWFTRDELNEITLALPVYLTLIDDWLLQATRS